MTILLAGSTGFLGSYLLKAFLSCGYKVIALKRKTSNSYRIDSYLNQITVYNTDVTDIKDIFEKHSIDIVINTVTDYGRKDNSLTSMVQTNLLFALELIETSINNKVKAFINTDTLLEPTINNYAFSKNQFVEWMKFLSRHDTKMINIKIEHMYGLLDDNNKFIYWFLNQLKSNVAMINLTSGIQKRDFIYIDDIVNAYLVVINNLKEFSKFEEFELGTGTSIEVKAFLILLFTEYSKQHTVISKLNFGAIPYRKNENMNMTADISKLQQLGWDATISVKEGIQRIVNEGH